MRSVLSFLLRKLDTETDGKIFKNAACFYPILVDVDD